MKFAVIVPVHNGGPDLALCLDAIDRSTRQPDRIVVVDDGSTDGAVRDLGVAYECVVLDDGPGGPARARNVGARRAGAVDILAFVDADVIVHDHTFASMEGILRGNPGVSALFGSYDDSPRERNIVSLYKNLLHHHTHQTGNPEARTFWAGCGAVRRDAFEAVGGFDEAYAKPSIEDIELGVRLSEKGYRIRLCPELLATHLKKWTLIGLVRTDIFARALPWSRLIVERDAFTNDLNLSLRQRVAALSALLLPGFVLLAYWHASLAVVLSSVALATFIGLNRELFGLFLRVGGLRLALGGALLHLLYYWYSTAAYLWVRTTARVSPQRERAESA